MADIQIAIKAKNEASAAINQTSADLATLTTSATDTSAALKTLGGVPQGITGTSTAIRGATADFAQLSSSVTDAAASLNNLTVEPIDLTASDGITPVLDDIRAQVEAGDLDVPALELTAIDNVSPIVEDIAAQANALSDQIEPIRIEVDDGNWRAPIDELQARLAETKASAQETAEALNNVSVKPIDLNARDNVSPAAKNAGGALQQLDNVAGNVAQGLGGLDSALALAGAALGLKGVVDLTRALYDLANAGAGFTALQDASVGLGEAFGANAKYIQYSMREAAQGTISDSALMLAANRAIVTGVTKNADVMARLLTEAKARATAFGLSAEQAFDTLITGISSAAPRTLKQLGYTVDLTEANRAYAASIGTTSDKLNEQQQRAALLNAVLAQSGKIPGIESQADDFERLGVSVDKVRIALGVLVASNFGGAIAKIADGVDLLAESLRDLPSGLEQSLSTSIIQLNAWQGKLGEAQQRNAGVSDFLFGRQEAGTFGPQIAEAERQVEALTRLQETVKLADQAVQAGVPGVQQYVTQINALASAAEGGTGLTKEQAAAVSELNTDLQNAISGLSSAAGAEGALGGAISATNPLLDEQTGKLKSLWIAAAGALGAAQAFAGYKASIDEVNKKLELNEKLNSLNLPVPPVEFVQAEINNDITKQINDLTKQANEPITLSVAVDNAALAVAQAKLQELRQAGVGREEAEAQALAVQVQTTDELNRQVEAWEAAGRTPEQIANVLLPTMRSELSTVTDGVSEMAKQFDSVKSKVAGLIQESQKLPGFKASDLYSTQELDRLGLSGDAQVSVDQAANGGVRPDAINENARRLMAIAAEGIQNQPWLEEFKREVPAIFAELENSPDIRGTGLRILKEFEAGMRPELLDRGMIKDRVKQMIIGEENAAALAEEIAREIAGELGISLQQAMSATNTALGIDTGEGAGGSNVQAPDMTPQGTLAGESLAAGMIAGFNADGMTVAIVAKIDAEFSNPKNIDALKKSGGMVGAVWGGGFLSTVGQNVPPGLYDVLVSGLVPLIVAAIGAQSTRTGAQP